MKRLFGRFWKDVAEYRLRVWLKRPYKDTETAEQLIRRIAGIDPEWSRRHSCACGHMTSTHELNGQRMGCCPANRPANLYD